MGCGGSKPTVLPYDDEPSNSSKAGEPAVAHADLRPGHKSVRIISQSASSKARHVDRRENKSFYDKSKSRVTFGQSGRSAGAKSRKPSAFHSRVPHRMDDTAADHKDSQGAKSKFAKSVKFVHDAVFGPPPEWILRQTAPIKSQYQFLGVVGRGQFGQVYCIRHVKQNTRYACKTLGKKKLLSQLDAEDIKREIEVMHHLSGHNLVVSLHRVFEDEKNVHLVMDLCQGDLYELLRQVKYLPEEQAAPLMFLAIKAVQYCHSMGVVHRDIKPENFLLAVKDDLSHIKLTDFGLSTFYQDGQVFNELLGSPYYIAPEVIKQKYGKEADVWSCGVMLYIMLCGEAPFFGEGDEGIFKSIMKAKLDFSFEPWPSLSRDVKVLLRRMLVKDPRERATLEEVVAHPWFARHAPPADPKAIALGGLHPVPAGRAGASPTPPGGPGPDCMLYARVRRYAAASRTKKAALRYIVASLPDEVTAGLYNLFQDFDQDANNAICTSEFREGFGRRGVALAEEEAAALVGSADLDGDGVLNLVEWLGATIYLPEDQVAGLVSEVFAFMDTDHNGLVSREELVRYLGEGQQQLADLILAEADTDRDGLISAAEFRVAYALTLERSHADSRPSTAGGGEQARGLEELHGAQPSGVAPGLRAGRASHGGHAGAGPGAGPAAAPAEGPPGVVRVTSISSVTSIGDDLARNSLARMKDMYDGKDPYATM